MIKMLSRLEEAAERLASQDEQRALDRMQQAYAKAKGDFDKFTSLTVNRFNASGPDKQGYVINALTELMKSSNLQYVVFQKKLERAEIEDLKNLRKEMNKSAS
jgi:hypothetical protein